MKRGGGGGGGGGGAGAGMCPAAAPLRFTQGPDRLQTPPGTAGRDGAGGMGEGGAGAPPPRCPPATVGSSRRRPEGKRGWGSPPPPRGCARLQRRPLPSCRSSIPRRLRVCLGRVGVVGLRGVWGWLLVVWFLFFFPLWFFFYPKAS